MNCKEGRLNFEFIVMPKDRCIHTQYLLSWWECQEPKNDV